jgi:hypothetical protein
MVMMKTSTVEVLVVVTVMAGIEEVMSDVMPWMKCR